MQYALIARTRTSTNSALIEDGFGAWDFMTPEASLERLSPGDAALGRLDVDPATDGVDDGLWALGALEARGIVVVNDAAALLSTHDKLLTARLLRRLGVRHPSTAHARSGRRAPLARGPVVVKPRFGSGGRGVVLCADEHELRAHLAQLEEHDWFREHGALVQELVPPRGFDLRLLVVGARVVGSVIRRAADGEWRTNISLGGSRQPIARPPSEAITVAISAVRAVGAALAGVDLVLDELDRWTVIEVNGAVEFTSEYTQDGDVFAKVIAALEALVLEKASVQRLAESL